MYFYVHFRIYRTLSDSKLILVISLYRYNFLILLVVFMFEETILSRGNVNSNLSAKFKKMCISFIRSVYCLKTNQFGLEILVF